MISNFNRFEIIIIHISRTVNRMLKPDVKMISSVNISEMDLTYAL